MTAYLSVACASNVVIYFFVLHFRVHVKTILKCYYEYSLQTYELDSPVSVEALTAVKVVELYHHLQVHLSQDTGALRFCGRSVG